MEFTDTRMWSRGSLYRIRSYVGKDKDRFKNKLLGLKSKTLKFASFQKDLKQLESGERLHICFGSRKLFNAQHHLEANG
jgi:hypothetical protein